MNTEEWYMFKKPENTHCHINHVHKFQVFKLKGDVITSKEILDEYFTILLVEKADGSHIIENVEHPLRPFQIHLVFPGQVHQFKCRNYLMYRFTVSNHTFKRICNYLIAPFSFYKRNPSLVVSPVTFFKLVYEFQCIYNELSKKENIWEIVMPRVRIITLMLSKETSRSFIKTPNSSYNKMVEFCKLIKIHCRTEKHVKFYADQLSINPNYLNIICKKYYNKTALSIINDELILEIKMQLATLNQSIKEIAFGLGFTNLSYFSTFFSTKVGISPRAYILMYKTNENCFEAPNL